MKRKFLSTYLLPLIGLVLAILLALSPNFVASRYYVAKVGSILAFVAMATSWTIFSTPTGYISLATAAFYGAGIYTAAFIGEFMPLPLVMIVAGLVSAVIALIVGFFTLRLRGVYFTIFTFGLVELLKNAILWAEIRISHTRGRFVVAVESIDVFYCILALLVLLVIAAYIIRRSRFGMALVSIGESEDAAAHIGINTTLYKIAAFAISSFAVGAVGAAMATRFNYIDPQIAFDATNSFMPVLMAIFGGTSSLAGPIAGAAVFAYLRETLITQPGAVGSSYMLIFGAIMVIAILFLPKGIVGLIQDIYRKLKLKKTEGDHAHTASKRP
jgi:branched-chain amino acid transport system permease protein